MPPGRTARRAQPPASGARARCRRAASGTGRRRAPARTRAASPGSGGRHQQRGGPAACGQSAASIGPETTAARRRVAASSAARSPSGFQSNTRCGASAQRLAEGVLPTLAKQRARGDEHARPEPCGSRRAGERPPLDAREALVIRGRLELANGAHLRRRREQAGLTPGELAQLVGLRERAEAVEEALDEVDLGLRERRVEPDAAHRGAVPAGRPRRRGCVRRG